MPRKKAVAVADEAPVKSTLKTQVVKAPATVKGPGAKTKMAEVVAAPSQEDMAELVLEMLGVSDVIDKVEEHFSIVQGVSDLNLLREGRVSTGSLCNDLMLAGGIYPGGWYNFSGLEGSGKSTNLMSWLGSIANSGVPLAFWWDFEGTASEDYITQMMEAQGVKISMRRLFGIRDDKGNYIKPPRVRYYNEDNGEKFYKVMAKILRSLPDKVNINGKWYLLYESNKENITKFKGKYTRYKGKLRIESPNGGMMQCLILLDSIAAMTTEEDEGEDGDGSRGLALDARMHSKHIKKVWSKLRKKMATVVSVNQMRTNPGQKYGNPNYEPGGKAIQHATSARIVQSTRAVPDFVPKTKENVDGQFYSEPSATGNGQDTYRFIHMKAIKNKLGVDSLEIWQRLWTSDAEGKARGFDPVWDCYWYLKMTGQLVGNVKLMDLYIKQGKKTVECTGLDWLTFKQMILLRGKDRKALYVEMGLKDMDVREMCAAQVADGSGLELYFQALAGDDADPEEEDYSDE